MMYTYQYAQWPLIFVYEPHIYRSVTICDILHCSDGLHDVKNWLARGHFNANMCQFYQLKYDAISHIQHSFVNYLLRDMVTNYMH